MPFGDLLVIRNSLPAHERVASLLATLRRGIMQTPTIGLLNPRESLKPWVVSLVAQATDDAPEARAKLPVREIAGRRFVSIGGMWVDATVHKDLRIVSIRPGSRAAEALLKLRPDLKPLCQADTHIIIRLNDTQAVQFCPTGAVSPSHPDVAPLIEALAPPEGTNK
jgi:hypothetical protein